MKNAILPSVGEVFSYRQYSDRTLTALHDALRANPQSNRRGSDESKRLATVRDEMKRRGVYRNVDVDTRREDARTHQAASRRRIPQLVQRCPNHQPNHKL